jgi:hypothetical protein
MEQSSVLWLVGKFTFLSNEAILKAKENARTGKLARPAAVFIGYVCEGANILQRERSVDVYFGPSSERGCPEFNVVSPVSMSSLATGCVQARRMHLLMQSMPKF